MNLCGLIFPSMRVRLIYASKDYQVIGYGSLSNLPSIFYLHDYCIR